MRLLIFFILLGVTGSALGGGESLCGTIRTNFSNLLLIVQTLVDSTFSSISGAVNSRPFVGNSYIAYFVSYLNISSFTFANGTSQLSGIGIDYVFGIMNGSITTPYISPLNCLEVEIASFLQYLQNIIQNLIPPLSLLVQSSPINANTPCSVVVQNMTPYYQLYSQISNQYSSLGLSSAAPFANIGLTGVFAQYVEYSQIELLNLLRDSLAEFLHMDPAIIGAYLADPTISVPTPLSCVKGIVNAAANIANSAINNVNDNIAPVIPSPNCEPFYSNFKAFESIWFNYIIQLRDYAVSKSAAYPVLTPYFIADLVCEVEVMTIFAANATSLLSGIDSEIIYNILTQSAVPPFDYPLSCIEKELIYLNKQLSILENKIIPGLEGFGATASVNTLTCNNSYQSLSPYVSTLTTLLNEKGVLISNGTVYFTTINFGDMFMESFATMLSCIPRLVGKYVGAALNGNGNIVTSFVAGTRFTLTYPFNCVNVLINIFSSMLGQGIVNFLTENPVPLVSPTIPKFFG